VLALLTILGPAAKAMENILEGRPSLGKGLGIEAITRARPVEVTLDETGVAELAEMLGDRRLGEGKKLDEAAADTTPAGAEDLEDAEADRMG
jgi:hypothetical protein